PPACGERAVLAMQRTRALKAFLVHDRPPLLVRNMRAMRLRRLVVAACLLLAFTAGLDLGFSAASSDASSASCRASSRTLPATSGAPARVRGATARSTASPARALVRLSATLNVMDPTQPPSVMAEKDSFGSFVSF